MVVSNPMLLDRIAGFLPSWAKLTLAFGDYRTVIMSARDGRVLFQKFDAYGPGGQR